MSECVVDVFLVLWWWQIASLYVGSSTYITIYEILLSLPYWFLDICWTNLIVERKLSTSIVYTKWRYTYTNGEWGHNHKDEREKIYVHQIPIYGVGICGRWVFENSQNRLFWFIFGSVCFCFCFCFVVFSFALFFIVWPMLPTTKWTWAISYIPNLPKL